MTTHSETDIDDDLPAYAVRLAPVVAAIAVDEYDRLASALGIVAANEWRVGLLSAWAGLAALLLRCLIAAEDDVFQEFRPGPSLRVFLYRLSRRNAAWRILFTVHVETADDPRLVQVHQMRHAAQAPLIKWPVEVDE